ncbi:outer membrane protein Iml2/Tetratricopeptide repeat protein 39 [Tuber borchii]|uniref:Inclusion body clearance protein IML2 n=1 Tax=Tuber borchii TaxID=42251 RepID=A0A2T6ZZY1_TUBBO|nr:outer membrane protein Iml2/Tetratricopeptide repeat protein 39 [Tuber borchii]
MRAASDRLADAEGSADRDQKRTIREKTQQSSFPPGTEFALAHAESQLMSAVVGVLSESVVESMKAFYKMRSAYKTLEGLQVHVSGSDTLLARLDRMDGSKVSLPKSLKASEKGSGGGGNSLNAGMAGLDMRPASADGVPPRNSSTGHLSAASLDSHYNSMDKFIISGTNLCFGMLLLILGMVPPSMKRIMAIVGFRGDRERGAEMLWKATKFDNVHGAIAVLTILQYYGNMAQFSDITPNDNHPSGIGYPADRCREALGWIRRRYPNAALWKLEEARMEAVKGNLDGAVAMLSASVVTQMKQVEALILFEKSLNQMFLHRYEDVADGFIKLTMLNNWSHALYNYFAAVCYIELYRQAKTSDAEKAEGWAKKAEDLFERIPSFMGKKRFMAQGLPVEVFADKKIKKWVARSKEKGIRLAEAVGVSPVEEMMFFWNGYRRMDQENFQKSLQALQYRGDEEMEDEAIDEQAIRWLLLSAVMRNAGQWEKARGYLEKIEEVDRTQFRGALVNDYMMPAAYYERAVGIWKETKEHTLGMLAEMRVLLDKAANYGAFELDARIGMRVTTALDTITRYEAWLKEHGETGITEKVPEESEVD